MMHDQESPPAARANAIKKVIIRYNKELRERHRWLRHQNVIGLSIMVLSVSLLLFSSALYIYSYIPWWLCLLLNAFFVSLVHEVEHDLIHDLYFRNNKLVYHAMMLTAWLVRPSNSNPWIRRNLHLRHHQLSGTAEDIEERAITNGSRWGFIRLLITSDLLLSSTKLFFDIPTWKERMHNLRIGGSALFPLTILTCCLWYYFLTVNLADWIFTLSGQPIIWSEAHQTFMHYLTIATVTLIAPNMLWSFCLHFVSSNIHYYGDIDSSNIIQQTQVMNSRWLWPFHLFCANFGSTHGIHHLVVNEPFYIRQMSARVAHQTMRENGVRFNDFGTFFRANRWSK
ncbi:fatty acid desaturase [Serratia surfactantfaciens]|nr:fatty acid desaturase [Serratia surfactantfaciens]